MMALSQKQGITRKRILKIIPNVYQLTIKSTNIILVTEKELTLIDTGFRGSSAQIIDFIHSLGRSVEEISLIIITHNHFDHAGGLAELRELTKVRVAIHQAEISDTGGQAAYPKTLPRLLRIPLFSALHRVFPGKSNGGDIRLTGGEVLKPLGGLKVIHTPGHTPGSISLFSPKSKLLFVGDALNKQRRTLRLPPKMTGTALTQAADSVKRMAQLDFDILCFGHGRPLTGDVHTSLQNLIKSVRD